MPDFPLIGGGALASGVGGNEGTTQGAVVTCGAANTKGSWQEVIAATPFAGAWLEFTAIRPSASDRYAYDIGIGPSTQERVIVPDVLMEFKNSASTPLSAFVQLPLATPKGARIAVRAQSVTASATSEVQVGVSAETFEGGPGYGRAETFGVTTSGATRGTAVDPGGSAHTDGPGSAVQLAAETSFDWRWMCVSLTHGQGNVSAVLRWLAKILVGTSSFEREVKTILAGGNTGTDQPFPNMVCGPVGVAKGSRISARARSSSTTATDRVIDVAVTGVG